MPAQPPVTFFLYAYNQEATVRQACESVLAQTYDALEVVFSDDASSDRTFEIMSEVAQAYHGPHRVRLNRNEKNLGIIPHVNRSNELVQTDLLIAGAGDDLSLPHRVQTIVAEYAARPGEVLAFHSSATKIDAAGRELGLWRPPSTVDTPAPEAIAESMSLVIGATLAWTKGVFGPPFGPITRRHAYEDLVIAFRCALAGRLRYIDEPLVRYRYGEGVSTTTRVSTSAAQRRAARVKQLRVVSEVFEQRLDDARAVHRDDLTERLEQAMWRSRTALAVHEGQGSAWATLRAARARGCLGVALRAYARRARDRLPTR